MKDVHFHDMRIARRRLKLSLEEIGKQLDPPISKYAVSQYEAMPFPKTEWGKQRLSQIVKIIQAEAGKLGVDLKPYQTEHLCPELVVHSLSKDGSV